MVCKVSRKALEWADRSAKSAIPDQKWAFRIRTLKRIKAPPESKCCYNLDMAATPKKRVNKSFMLRIRMTEADRDLLEEAARYKSLKLSSWARSELVALARKMLGKK